MRIDEMRLGEEDSRDQLKRHQTVVRNSQKQTRMQFQGVSQTFNFMKRLDMFGARLPSLNIAGEGRIRTHFGGVVTLLIFYVTFLFACLKF